jgi:manganese/zinc/iron transport system permease protein
MYLTQQLQIQDDHVHEDAEAIEHIITPEIERKLIELLDKPEKDPHEKIIPY